MPNKPLQAVSLTSPGYFGLNNQDSPVTLNPAFATQAYNAVIDKFGRIGARKGWTYNTTSGGTASDIEVIFEFDNNDNTYTYISAGNNKIYTGEATLTQAAVRNSDNSGDLTYTITDNNWQIVQAQYQSGLNLSPHAYLVQKSHAPLVYHKLGTTAHAHTGSYGFQRIADVGNIPTGYSATTFYPNCALAAYGRLWLADIGTDNLTIYYSVLLDTTDFTGTGSGFINLEQVIPGGDKIVALADYNNFLIVFCKNNIVIYNNANDLDNLQLQDVIEGVGCLARDSVQSIGSDLIFLSDSGLRSIGRVIQEKSSPLRDLSRNVRDNFMTTVFSQDGNTIRSVYHPKEAMYLLSLPTGGFTYCFDVRSQLEDGSYRVTVWTAIAPKGLCSTRGQRLLLGKTDGIAEYEGYTDNGNRYIFSYYTPYIDFGDPSLTKILKKIAVTVVGASNTTLDIRWAFDYTSKYNSTQATTENAPVSEYGVAEYNVAEYAASIFIDQLSKQLSGSGNVVQIGVDASINGYPLSLQKLDIYSVTGRII
jgi:hypothetical protein